MKKIILVLLLIFSSQSAYFQTPENKKAIDSLTILLRTKKEDVSKLNLYHSLCKQYYPYDKAQMIQYNDKLLALSKKTKHIRGIGLYYLNLTDIDYMDGNLEKATSDGEKAYRILSKTKDTINHLNSILYLAFAYTDNSESGKARKLLHDNLKLAHTYNDVKTLAKMYLYLGQSLDDDLGSKEQLKWYKKSLHYYNLSNDKRGKIALYHNIAMVYKKIDLYEESLKYLNLIFTLHPEEYHKQIALFEISRIYNKIGRYSEAKNLALKTEKKLINSNQKASNIFWVNKLSLAISNFGLKEYTETINNCDAILKVDLDATTKTAALDLISDSYLKLNNLAKAQFYIDQSLKLNTSVISVEKGESYMIKSEIEEALGNYKTALEYRKKHSDITFENNQKINKNKIQQLQTDFDVADKNNQIKKLEISELQQKLNLKKQQNYITVISLILVIALLSIVLFYKVYNTIKRKNNIIETNNIALSKAQLLTQKSLTEKELLLKEIHHRVKNNLQLVMSLLNIQAREGSTQNINDFLEKGQSRIVSMALIHQNLYQTERLDKVNFQEYTENLVESIKETFGKQHQNTSTVIQIENINFDIQTAIPLGLIINELFCNALKHAFPENDFGKVTISITEKENKTFELTVSDNGVGIKNNPNSKKTLGLELVYLLSNQLNGKVTSENVDGTTFRILFKEIAA